MEKKSCCAESQPSRAEFLHQKLQNFRAFIEPFCTQEKNKTRLQEFSSLDAIMPFLLQALALKKAGVLEPALERFTQEFAPFTEGQEEAFRAKINRYVTMFCDVLAT